MEQIKMISSEEVYREQQRKIFSENFNRLLQEKGKTQADVFHALKNIERQTVSAWACGKAVPRMDRVEAIANFFGVEKSELLEENVSGEVNTIIRKIKKLSPSALVSLDSYIDFLLSDKRNKK